MHRTVVRNTDTLEDIGSFPCLNGKKKPCSQKDAIRPQFFPSLQNQVTATCPRMGFHGNCGSHLGLRPVTLRLRHLHHSNSGPMSFQDSAEPHESGTPKAVSDGFLLGMQGRKSLKYFRDLSCFPTVALSPQVNKQKVYLCCIHPPKK